MGIHRLPRIRNYWSKDYFLGIPALKRCMPLGRFWALLSNLHVVDNESIDASGGVSRKLKPVLDTLSSTFLQSYRYSQELFVDEGMAKYTGCVKRKVVMPKNLSGKVLRFGVVLAPVPDTCVRFRFTMVGRWMK